MMSTALLVSAGAEQTNVSFASAGFLPDQEGLAGTSFAKSLTERVDVPVLPATHLAAPNLPVPNLPVPKGAEEQPIGLSGLKDLALGKRSEEVAETQDKGIFKNPEARESLSQGELQRASVGKTIQQAPVVAAGPQKFLTVPGEVETVKVTPLVEEADENILPGATPPISPTTGTAIEEPGAPPDVADEGRDLDVNAGRLPLVSSGRPVVRGEIEAQGETKEAASAKKAAKVQEKTPEVKSGEKNVTSVVTTAADQPRSVAGHLAAGSIPAAIPAPVLTAALPSEIGRQVEDFNLEKASTGTARPLVSSSRSNAEPAQQTGTADVDAKANAGGVVTTADNNPIPSPKSSVSSDKSTTIEAPASSESKTQFVSGPVGQLVHAVSGGGDSTSSGALSGVVASGNAQGDLSAIKSPVGVATAHPPGNLSGLKEQGESGGVTQPTEATPRVLTATPTALEVGIQNGTHGWLRVRAEMADGGGVSASVSAASSAGQEMLHRELPALTAYLQQEKVAVSAVVVHVPAAAGADVRGSSGSSGMGNTGGEISQRSGEGGEQRRDEDGKALANGAEEAMIAPVSQGVDEGGSLPLASYAVGGGWLSVRA
jgi:hypothetical protein